MGGMWTAGGNRNIAANRPAPAVRSNSGRVVPAGVKRVAAKNPPCPAERSRNRPVLPHRLNIVLTAGWIEAAAPAKQRTENQLVQSHAAIEQPCRQCPHEAGRVPPQPRGRMVDILPVIGVRLRLRNMFGPAHQSFPCCLLVSPSVRPAAGNGFSPPSFAPRLSAPERPAAPERPRRRCAARAPVPPA